MHKIWFFVLLLSCCFLSCDEIPPEIHPIVDQGECPIADESEVSDQERTVLIEEFTGIRCVNCPAGSEAIDNLLNIHHSRLVAVSIHAGFFSPPYNESLYDFRTEHGDAILSFLGEPLGFPTAVINRRLFDGETDLQVSQNQWADFINQELAKELKVKIALNSNYDEGSREITAEVSIFILDEIEEDDFRLSLMITESGIIDVQLTPAGIATDYEHNHVLRTMLTNFDGNPLTEALSAGQSFCKMYTGLISEDWDPDNCQLIAFVHAGGSSKEVYQVQEIYILN